eukprot:94406-Rhodomonas_salina.2
MSQHGFNAYMQSLAHRSLSRDLTLTYTVCWPGLLLEGIVAYPSDAMLGRRGELFWGDGSDGRFLFMQL